MKALKLLLFSIGLIWFCNYSVGLDINRMRIAHPSGSGEIFHGGVYIYINQAVFTDAMMENHIRLMAQQGLTHLYIAYYNSTNITPGKIIQWCRKYGVYVSFQAREYYSGSESQSTLEAKASATADFFNEFLSEPEFLTMSVREEPPNEQDFLDALYYYYSLVNYTYCANYSCQEVLPFYLLHNYALGLASEMTFQPYPGADEVKPFMTGTDRTYVYQWRYNVPVAGHLGYLSSPRKALNIINNYLRDYSSYIDPETQWAAAVFLGTVSRCEKNKSDLLSQYGQNAFDHWESLAQYNGGEGNQGLKDNGSSILSWGPGFYMPPANCTSCDVWLGVARGYRSIFVWKCDPWSTYKDIMGIDFKGSAKLDEYGKTICELQQYGWLINHMEYDVSEAYISYTDDPLYTIYSGSFDIPDYSGKIAVLVNANVGAWCNDSTLYFSGTDVFRIDDNGYVKTSDYTPNTAPRSISITNQVAGTPNMYDLETGMLIGSFPGTVDVLPGKGKFIFIGDSTELEEIRAKCGITTITTLTGLIPNREIIPNNIQICDPQNPIINSQNYQLATRLIDRNKRYRLHITAKSSDGAALGVLPGYYDGSWHTYNIECVDGSVLWNKSLGATSTTFVSEDFTVTQGTQARIFLYRSNRTGTIEIEDAWLEACDETSPTNIQICYAVDPITSSTSYQLATRLIDRNKRYRLHITAKSSNGAALGVLPGYYDGSWHTYNIECVDGSVLWNKSLGATSTTFVSEDFTVTQGTQARIFLYRSNRTGTIEIEDAWLEDCNSHRQISSEWISPLSFTVNGGEGYQIYARARNYPGESIPAEFGINLYEYDSSDNLLGAYYHTDPVIEDEELSADPKVFKATFEKNNTNAAYVKIGFVNTTGAGTLILESVCVGETTIP